MPGNTESARRIGEARFAPHITGLIHLLARLDDNKIENIADLLKGDKTIFIVGNGGSAGTASHFAEDLAYGAKKGIRAISLTDNTPYITAIANDEGYEHIFTRQLETLFREGDIVIGISVSGNSPNVINALEYANKHKGVSIGLLGFDGGKAKRICQHYIHMESDDYGLVEDMHLILVHLVTEYLRERD